MPRPYLKEIDSCIKMPLLSSYDQAVFILHDQLNLQRWPDWILKKKPLLIFMESGEKGRELPHHKKKAVYILSSMRHFALECAEAGFPVHYHSTDGHFDDGLRDILSEFAGTLYTMTPSEWDTRERYLSVKADFNNRFEILPNTFFLADAGKYKDEIRPGYRMEYFYREMRRQTGYLMNGDLPEGGEWNYDEQNRKPLPKNHPVSQIPAFEPDDITTEVIRMVDEYFPDSFGHTDQFVYAVNRNQALQLLDDFIKKRLAEFGPFEDALKTGNSTLFHSQLSVYLNNGLLLPEEICEAALQAYEKGEVPLNSVEGLIRQIIGWREFIRIYYEAMMPDVRKANHFGFTGKLPDLYWTAETKMKCLNECVQPVIDQAYSHHIQRLMVLSNFSNLTQTDPHDLHLWFLSAYADAYEWVELPNVLGMSTFADGGVLASKPYVSGGNYINKMSDYCKSCSYNVKEKTGEGACPFNYLYWNFVDKQRETFSDSGRVNFMVNMFDKKKQVEKEDIRESSEKFLKKLKRQQQSD